MAFNPSSIIYLCNAPIDNTYSNQIYFKNRNEQNSYFHERVVKTFTNYLTVRETLPDGSLQSAVKVDANIDDLYGCNYMYYQNANHGTRWFYAFITKLIYVNEGTTKIVFETDVWQTWKFDIELKPSFVEREHSESDEIGENLVPEPFNVNDFHYYRVADAFTDIGQWGYLIACTERVYGYKQTLDPDDVWIDEEVSPSKHSGIYQGLYFYYFTSFIDINAFIKMLSDKGKDSIISITCIPEFSVQHAKKLWRTIVNGQYHIDDTIGIISSTDYPNERIIQINVVNTIGDNGMDGYTDIRNNKLWNYPFCSLIGTNHSGDRREYVIEDFPNRKNIVFTLYGDISPSPSLYLSPKEYKGGKETLQDDNYGENVDYGLSIDGFPQCAFVNDFFKLWSAKNTGSQIIKTGAGVTSAVMGALVTASGHPIAGVGMIAGGVNTIANVINNTHVASIEADKGTVGYAKNNLLTAMKRNKFDFEVKTLKYDQAKSIDDYFTMFGYQTNKLKLPNLSSRPYFNYVKTIDVNIIGGIPDTDMRTMKTMFNTGVTFWKPTATVGDYSVDNSPS